VTKDQAPGAQGEYAGQGKRGWEPTAGPCVGEAADGRRCGGVHRRRGVPGGQQGLGNVPTT
jgi:hypothetical protein